jgi:hypothetical protein
MSTPLTVLAAGTLAVAFALSATPQTASGAQSSKAPTAATAPAKQRTPQQQRMADCSHRAKVDNKKGAERKTFMSSCLKGEKAAQTAKAAPATKPKAKAPTNDSK